MFVDQLATTTDVIRILGEVDAQTVSQILAIAPTCDELARAVHERGDDDGEEPGTPSSARVASIRQVLTRLAPPDPGDDAATAAC